MSFAPAPEPPLPPGWEKMTDRPTVYYKNSDLQVEQADRPGLPENPAVGAILCGASLPLDSVAAECSANAPPPPLKAYLLSILTPILEESADALFETLRVKPYELAETAVSDAVMTQALTPEVLERMKALNDPQVQQVLADFKANVQTAVQASADILNKGVGDNIGELLGSIVNKLSSAIQLLMADIPGWGVVMSGAELADTALAAVEQGQVIADEVQHALEPLNAIGAQVAQVTSAVDAATNAVSAATNEAPTNVVSEAPNSAVSEAPNSAVSEAPNSVAPTNVVSEAPVSEAPNSVATPSGNKVPNSVATPSGNKVPNSVVSVAPVSVAPVSVAPVSVAPVSVAPVSVAPVSVAPVSVAPVSVAPVSVAPVSVAPVSVAPVSVAPVSASTPSVDVVTPRGGSRKRRHIHKLSRRIERTLRRVQKKYGLRNKNDFLRRTLRVRKMK